jgi:hypothetical protein
MSGSTPKRSIRVSDGDWEQLAADADLAGKERTEYLLDCWRQTRDPSRKLPRLYVQAQTASVREALLHAIKTLDKLTR